MGEVFLDALIDSLKVLAILVVVYIAIAFFEPQINKSLTKKSKLAPLFAVSLGLLPQCGFSVAATDLYQKRRLQIGTLLGIYLATSDEALPILLAYPDKAIAILPLLAIKFIAGISVAYLFNWAFSKKVLAEATDEHCARDCCDNIYSRKKFNVKNEKLDRYLIHPLIHSLKIFAYVLAINIVFGIIIYYLGEESLSGFLTSNKFIAPIFAVIVGLIPNCAASVVITNLYIMGGLGFGATVAGLSVNAGLGLMVLFKTKENLKEKFIILGILIAISLIIGYATSLVLWFK